MYNRNKRGGHSLIKDSLDAATVILPKEKEHQQQAIVIQANVRARERVTASFFSY